MSKITKIPKSWEPNSLWACEGTIDWSSPMEINAEGSPPTWYEESGRITKMSIRVQNIGNKIIIN